MRFLLPRLILTAIIVYAALLMFFPSARKYLIKAQTKNIERLNQKNLKYILLWTTQFNLPLMMLGERYSQYISDNCNYINCVLTDDINYFKDQTDFDAIVIRGIDVRHISPSQIGKRRLSVQKYIFLAPESADNYPVCDEAYDGFFNWTWTYRLDSDLQWSYITITDLNDNVVGPAMDMKWRDRFDPISEELKVRLSNKLKAAAWFVSDCDTKGKRENFVKALQEELGVYGWEIDIYGACGTLVCSKNDQKSCCKILEENYYFYLSFENSFSEDYVTEKLLTALNCFAVPIVYGGANYSRRKSINEKYTLSKIGIISAWIYLPPGSYLDAIDLGTKDLASCMNKIIMYKNKYHHFFRWRNHYRYLNDHLPEEICKLFNAMNDVEKVSKETTWADFRTLWDGRLSDNC